MSNLRLDKLNIAAAPPEKLALPLDLIHFRIDTPTFGDHLKRAAGPPAKPEPTDHRKPPRKPEPVRNNDDDQRTRAEGEVAGETPTADYRAEGHDASEQNPNEEPSNEDPNEPDEVEGEETQVNATNENGQDVAAAAVLPQATETPPLDEERIVKEIVSEKAGEKIVAQRGPEASPHPADGAKATIKAAATDQPPVDPSNVEQIESENDLQVHVDDVAGKISKAERAEHVIGSKETKTEDDTAAPATPKETKPEEAGHVAAPVPNDEGDIEGRKQSNKRARRPVGRSATSPPNQSRTPAAAPSAPALDGSPSVEKPAVATELEQAVTQTPARDATADTAAVRVGGQHPTSAPVAETLPIPTTEQRIANRLDPISVNQTTRTSGQSDAERVRFVQRVARAFHAAGEQGGKVTLRLNPPELGSVRLEVTIRDGALRAHLETETTTARHALLENLPALRERLAEQNVKIEQFDVDLRDDGRGSDAETHAGEREQQSNGRANENRTARTLAVDSERPKHSEPAALTNENGLNVIV